MPVYYYGPEGYVAKERFQYWLQNRPQAIAIDIETESLVERYPVGFALALSPDEAIYFDLQDDTPAELSFIIPWLQDKEIVKIAHNWPFDMAVFPLLPVVGGKLERSNIWDSNAAARLLGHTETSLPVLALELGICIEGAGALLAKHKASTMVEVPRMEVAQHCQMDARVSYRLYLEWKDKIAEQKEYFDIEMKVIPILVDLSLRGIKIDQQVRAELAQKYSDDIEFYKSIVQGFGVEKPGSNQQIGYILAKRGNFLPFTRNRKRPQLRTGVEVLEFLDDPMAAAVLGYRQKSKFKNTYLDPMGLSDRFYTEYYLDTVVGRLNSRNRNIQNIPPDARCMFLPDNGMFTSGDYAKEHLFILAQVSKDRDMLRVLYEPDKKRSDIHQFTADRMGVTRLLAKTLNYAVVYGATARTVSEQAKIKDLRRCERLIEDWFRTYKEAADWIRYAQEVGLKDGWALPTLFDRKIRLPMEESEDAIKRKAVNYPILGSDGEIIKRAIIACDRVGLGPPLMAITVHDSITWDGDVKDRIPVEELEHIPGYRIPFEIKETHTWE